MNQSDAPPPKAVSDVGLRLTSVAGVFGHTERFELVIEGLSRAISRLREKGTEIVRFPPVMSRAQLERSGYLHSFPHLLGCVSCIPGDEPAVRRVVDSGNAWVRGLEATELVLTPAACYPLYPLAAERGPVAAEGLRFDVSSYCFRHESTHEIGRFQSFRMREYVFVGSPQQAFDFRARLAASAQRLAEELRLPFKIAAASDPFFGRAGKLMALSQMEQALKYELVVSLGSEHAEIACMSFNSHRDHFGGAWDIRTDAGETAHTACVAFGMDRLALALFVSHGPEPEEWPNDVRKLLGL